MMAGNHHFMQKRAGSADEGQQRTLLRLSRGSSAKRTAKEIIDYLVPDEERHQINGELMKERDKLIKYNKQYLKKHRQMP